MKTYQRIVRQKSHPNVNSAFRIDTVDMHTGGEPLRVVLRGFPKLEGNSILDFRRDCIDNYDQLRKFLMFEPRGHADMYGCVLTPPNDEDGDFGVVFMHNEGYSTMCGHAIIALSTLAAEMNWIDIQEGENILTIDAPCGRIRSYVSIKQKKVTGVRFEGVPSFVVGLDKVVNVPDLGTVIYDLAYGGAFYAYVDLEKNQLDIDLEPDNYEKLVQYGRMIKRAVIKVDDEIVHPFEKDLSFLYGTIFTKTSDKPGIDSRNVCVFADGEVDRCPTGSGVSGRMAIHRARRELEIGNRMTIESITSSTFKAAVLQEVDFGPFKAVIPEVEGRAFITGFHTFVLDPDDPVKTGFIFR